MPRTLKRRSDAISRDTSPPASPGPSQRHTNTRRQRSPSSSAVSSASDSDDNNDGTKPSTNPETSIQTLAKKLVRLALSSEYARLPLRRTDIATKIFKESSAPSRLFKPVFAAAQLQLRHVFGMQLVELPSKDKTSLRDRRTQATQTQQRQQTQTQKPQSKSNPSGGSTTSTKSWILTSTLPHSYKTSPLLTTPTSAPTRTPESQYTALYTFILSLVYLNNSTLPESKLERYLRRVNADTYTPLGGLDKLLARMVKEGYLDRRRDTSLGPADEVVEYSVGPRGKVEVGVTGVAGLVRSVYGFGSVGLGDVDGDSEEEDGDGAEGQPKKLVKIERDELEKRLKRSLGEGVTDGSTGVEMKGRGDGDGDEPDAMQVDRERRPDREHSEAEDEEDRPRRRAVPRSSARNTQVDSTRGRNVRTRRRGDEEEDEDSGDTDK